MTYAKSSNKRIAKNTVMLYARMVIIMLVSLYTSRVILNSLGVVDYGVYNVVTGFVLAFGFLNSAMNASVQRFLTVEFKENNTEKLNKVFNLSVLVHFFLAIIVVVATEAIGLYFVKNKLVIPAERLTAAIWIFHLSVVTLFFSIMNVPYRALIITHEDMGTFAVISLFEAFAKLFIAIIIGYVIWDKLVTYGLLLAIIAVVIQLFYMLNCRIRYKNEVTFKPKWDSALFKDMTVFAGWNLLGVFAGIAYNQGVNIVINLFGGPVVNAARAIAFQVSGAANQLVTNFQMAVNPPIMKAFVAKDKETTSLICSSSKLSNILLLFVAVPLIIEMPYILQIWLKTVPEYTVILARLALIEALVCSFAGPLHTLFQATGEIKQYQLIISGILLFNLPISYVLLRFGFGYEITVVVAISLSFLALVARLILIKKHLDLKLLFFIRVVFLPCLLVAVISTFCAFCITRVFPVGITRLILVILMSVISITVMSYLCAFNSKEKLLVKEVIKKIRLK
ncbi:MAG: lipopolysaccharide biosynthesis protein [Prevotella sp.]|nr:lipopolysaccharide biosynthesis protein [Prevotella sp.]